jgi:hypothetical protein
MGLCSGAGTGWRALPRGRAPQPIQGRLGKPQIHVHGRDRRGRLTRGATALTRPTSAGADIAVRVLSLPANNAVSGSGFWW